MNPDLTRLIRLQQLETAADEARRAIADYPGRTQAFDDRLQSARDAVSGARARLTAAQEQAREQLRRFLTPGTGYRPTTVRMFQ